MKQTFVLRLAGEMCFYYAVLHCFGIFAPWTLPMALFAALCLGVGLAAVRCPSPAARAGLALLPGLAFALGPFQGWMLLPLLAWPYYVAMLARGYWAMPLYEYRKGYTALLVVCLFFVAANIANATLYRDQWISAPSLVYTFAFLLLGVMAMRRMQMGADMRWDWKWRNALAVAGFPVLAAGISVGLFLLLRFTQWGLAAVLTPLGRLLNWLLHRLFPTGHAPIEEMSLAEALSMYQSETPLEAVTNGGESALVAPEGSYVNHRVIEQVAGLGAWVVLGALLLLAVVCIFRHLRRQASAPEEETLYEDTQTQPTAPARRRGRMLPPVGPVRQMRRIYKTYLEFRRAGGMPVQPADTSAQILARERPGSAGEDALRLRQMYIAARYGDPGLITRAQVREAQACLERIVQGG